MSDEDTIIVTFDDDENVGAGEPQDGSKPADDPVEDLKGQLSNMQQRATRAEQTAQQATQRATQLEQEVVKTKGEATEARTDLISTGIEKQQSELDRAEQSYKQAFEAGDATLMAKSQREMAMAASRMTQLEAAKANVEAAPKPAQRTEQVAQQRTVPRADDPVEHLASSLSAPSAAWVRAHPDVVTDPRRNAKMLAGHNDAIAEGIALDTPEYFSHIEKHLGLKKAEPEGKPAPQRRTAAPAAPVINSSGGTSGNGSMEVRISQKEKTSATDGTIPWNYDDPKGRFKKGDPIGVQEFARRKLQMQKDGLYDKTLQE